jgi:polysaccharide biosynthesis/export protein
MFRAGRPVLVVILSAGVVGCGRGNSAALPDPIPVAAVQSVPAGNLESRRIGAEDLLEVTVFEAPELSRSARVSSDGTISLPVLGSVPAAGLTSNELADRLEDRLRGTYMVDPHVTVDVAEVRSRAIYVLGAVNKPGAYPLTGYEHLTVLRALALGEGVHGNAARGSAFIIRSGSSGQREEIPVDIGALLAGEAVDPSLQADDILYVPNSPVKALARGVTDALVRMATLGRIF